MLNEAGTSYVIFCQFVHAMLGCMRRSVNPKPNPIHPMPCARKPRGPRHTEATRYWFGLYRPLGLGCNRSPGRAPCYGFCQGWEAQSLDSYPASHPTVLKAQRELKYPRPVLSHQAHTSQPTKSTKPHNKPGLGFRV